MRRKPTRMTKTNIIKALLLFLCWLCLCLPAALASGTEKASGSHQTDSLSAGEENLPQVRHISGERLQELRDDAAMDYYLASPDDNLWVMFRNWLYLQFLRLFGSAGALSVLAIIVYILCLVALVFVVLRLLNVDLSGLLMNGKRKAVVRDEALDPEEDIHEIDFQAAISEALQKQEYNKAIRLLYLSALKALSDREHIRWQPGKTNYQYQQELQQSELQAPFQQLGQVFEWAWYGNFQVGEAQYRRAEQYYQQLGRQLKQVA